MGKIGNPGELQKYREGLHGRRGESKQVVAVCCGTGCNASGAKKVAAAFFEEIEKQGLSGKVEVRPTGCHGFCERGTLVLLHPAETLYQRVKPEDVAEIVEKTVAKGEVIERHLYDNPVTGEKHVKENDIPFYKHQRRLILGKNGLIDPTKIDDYVALGGYAALAKALEMGPERVLDEVKRANVRGRGGGGFPAGRKWETCRNAKADKRYVICNADEGDPGAFMDRSVLEGNPHAVIEGMLIGAFTIGSDEGYVYVRHEYPLAVKHLAIALEQAREKGLLGKDILGTGFSFDVKINRGGGAFVCGESTALMASLEGLPGEPRAKYVHTVEHGLHDLPTVLNNVETWANVPRIAAEGAEAFAAVGTAHSKGTKIFSLVGKINNTGLVEVPMGIPLRDIVYGIGGGIPGGKRFKAVQTGGPSGGCIPESLLDLQVDFQKLTEVGSMMGSGGMIVMDEDTCMVDVARYFVGFLEKESCGKCVPCREGLAAASQVLGRITAGEGREGDLELLGELGEWLAAASLCALGGSAANPVVSTITHFRGEYEAHIRDHKCPGGVCRALITYSIDANSCNGCMACAKVCPETAITGERKQPHALDAAKCIKCGACISACKQGAIIRK